MSELIPTALDFQKELEQIIRSAQQSGLHEVKVKSGDLHRRVGGYPSNNHRMPVCCQVMRAAMRPGDQILAAPPKGDGATLLIRYRLPR
jgi:5-methylcytosine-specific restriction protein A